MIQSKQIAGSPGGPFFLQGGNSFNAPATTGTLDNQDYRVITHGVRRFTILKTGQISVGPFDPSLVSALEIQDSAGSLFAEFTNNPSEPLIATFRRDLVGALVFTIANADPDPSSYAAFRASTDTTSYAMRALSGAAAMPNAWQLVREGVNPRIIVDDAGRVALGPATPDPSAQLDIPSTAGGLLPPRMTTTDRNLIPNPATGLLIINTYTHEPQVNIGTPAAPAWASMAVQHSTTPVNFLNGALTVTPLSAGKPLYLTSSSVILVTVDVPNTGGGGTITWTADVRTTDLTGAAQFTIHALKADGTINALDNSTGVRWAILGL